MDQRIYNVLFLCTGNSARSILGEAILNHSGDSHAEGRRFRGYSAGSHPKGAVHPLTLKLLQQFDMPTGNLRSKSWDEFAKPDAPQMDFIFTVCDQAAGEMCPIWPGKPVTAHWGIPDPAAVEGDEITRLQAFRDAFRVLERRISLFVNLRLDRLDAMALSSVLSDIEHYHDDQRVK
jgi:arsenate reductase (thioredoxin)